MRLLWEDRAWSDYLYWQTQDKKTLKRINGLIKDIQRSTFEGIGKPEPLKENLRGMWSRRIDDANRIVYFEKDCFMQSALRRLKRGRATALFFGLLFRCETMKILTGLCRKNRSKCVFAPFTTCRKHILLL